jgi:hypothetical protein
MMLDKRLIGTWRSDKKRTAQEIRSRRDISTGKRRTFLINIFGKLTVRFTRTKCYTTLKGCTDVGPLRIVAKDAGGVVILSRSIGGDIIYHIRFEHRPNGGLPNYYWICLGQFREYFRRVNRTPAPDGSKRRRKRPADADQTQQIPSAD